MMRNGHVDLLCLAAPMPLESVDTMATHHLRRRTLTYKGCLTPYSILLSLCLLVRAWCVHPS